MQARVAIEDFKWGASAHQQHWLCGTGSQNVKQVFPTLLGGGVGLGRATWRDQTVKYWRYIATPGKALPVLSKKTQNMFWHLSTFPLIWAFLPFEAAAVRSRSFQASQGKCMGSCNAYIPYFPTWQCVRYPTCQLGNAYATLFPYLVMHTYPTSLHGNAYVPYFPLGNAYVPNFPTW